MSMFKNFNFLLFGIAPFFFCHYLFSVKDTPLGKIDLSASLTGIYDSRVFGVSSNMFNISRSGANPKIPSNELESEDDFILKFSPAVHLSNKVSLLKFSGSAGVEIAQYVKNSDKSYVIPITSIILDFDDTLSKRKRISNNAKIRFDATFDVGQHVGASVLEQDLVSYTYFTTGINLRYNHSAKFGIGGGTNYTYQDYQSGSTAPRLYSDLSSLPLHARAFYIYSEKLDLFSEYSYTRSQAHNNRRGKSLADSVSNSLSFGANGQISPKLSGTASIGYSHLSFDNSQFESQQTIISSISLDWKYNEKTSSRLLINRNFSPSAQGFSNLSTFSRLTIDHRFVEDLRGSFYLSAGHSEYSYPDAKDPAKGETSSFNSYGFGFEVTKKISKSLSTSGGYDYSYVDRDLDNFSRHVLQVQLFGRF